MTKVYLISLGCPKNLVDSEVILGLLEKADMEICEDAESAQILLLNTCAFIKEAKEESIDLILELAKLKKQDPNKKIAVIGCLVQRYLNELKKELPEVDFWITIDEIPKIADLLKGHSHNVSLGTPSFLYDDNMPRHMITPKHYAYVKIAEGCSNRCSYCAVPNIKGEFRARATDSIFKEAKKFAINGVKEINIIAQDTTNYPNITELLRGICEIKGIKWIRLLYTHPAHITDDLIKEIARQDKICKYIDLPLQHIDDDILNKMGRKVDSSYIKKLIKKIRGIIPEVVLRTSFIVGFPGETEEKYKKLLDFMEEIKFERLGIFRYSREEGTPAYKMKDQVPEKIKEDRFHIAMQLQNNVAREVNRKFLGKTIDVLLEGPNDSQNLWIGRTYADAPEVDGVVYMEPHGLTPVAAAAVIAPLRGDIPNALSSTGIHPGRLPPSRGGINDNGVKAGDMIKVKITGTMDYDLVGETIGELAGELTQ